MGKILDTYKKYIQNANKYMKRCLKSSVDDLYTQYVTQYQLYTQQEMSVTKKHAQGCLWQCYL